jgi:hypothetical protein
MQSTLQIEICKNKTEERLKMKSTTFQKKYHKYFLKKWIRIFEKEISQQERLPI